MLKTEYLGIQCTHRACGNGNKEDSEPTGLKVDIADVPTGPVIIETRTARGMRITDCGASSGSDRGHVVLNELLGIFKTLVQPQRVG